MTEHKVSNYVDEHHLGDILNWFLSVIKVILQDQLFYELLFVIIESYVFSVPRIKFHFVNFQISYVKCLKSLSDLFKSY